MKLKRIELHGFKSFAKKARLDFSVPVVGIVGPNGSGKSNVVEAFRFVLGEQSMKSLRGKSGKDLIFKGSKDLPKGNRASVEIVFDNADKVFKLSDRPEPINLDYDEIILKREVFADGTNTYSINGAAVRLKDIVELLSSVSIGSSGHHIISQGEADRILSASAKDRRLMVEDALGMKAYQYKIKEATRKLEKTEENMKEVGLVRRELAPHIKYLKKQVEKVEKGAELKTTLASLYLAYFKHEDEFLRHEEGELKSHAHEAEKELKEIEVKLLAFGKRAEEAVHDARLDEARKLDDEATHLGRTKDELSRKLGRIEGMIEIESRGTVGGTVSIKESTAREFLAGLESALATSLADTDLMSVRANLTRIQTSVAAFRATLAMKAAPETSFKDLAKTKEDVIAQLDEIEERRKDLAGRAHTLRREVEASQAARVKDQEERFMLEARKNKLEAETEVRRARHEMYARRKTHFDDEMKTAVHMIGHSILQFKNEAPGLAAMKSVDELSHEIEKIKLRLEDIGGGGGEDIMKEYKEVSERDEFLARELTDLEKSIENLKTLIDDLKETLEREFKEGLQKINERFEEFFKLMFGGGSAYLSAVVQNARRAALEDDEDPSTSLGADDLEDRPELGIDINVTLPQKKVKDLHMLSGGERSLTSIALVFAITQVNPPPFLVLDETDAALDEANSRRYGDMIEMLSKYSSLITVTHNRETMSRAHVIYGVTIGSDGGSKLLSIKFNEAESYAK